MGNDLEKLENGDKCNTRDFRYGGTFIYAAVELTSTMAPGSKLPEVL